MNPTRTSKRLASVSVMPLTSGTTRNGRGPEPSDTATRTTLLGAARTPPAGRWRTTRPRGRLDVTGKESTRNPARWSCRNAALWPIPTTPGTFAPVLGVFVVVPVWVVVVPVCVVVGGPPETSMATIEPRAACAPSAGFCEMTSPLCFVEETRETPAWKPVAVNFAIAAASVSPTTLGTVPSAPPFEMVSATVEPFCAGVPAVGS